MRACLAGICIGHMFNGHMFNGHIYRAGLLFAGHIFGAYLPIQVIRAYLSGEQYLAYRLLK